MICFVTVRSRTYTYEDENGDAVSVMYADYHFDCYTTGGGEAANRAASRVHPRPY
jgi:hypothetical protein